MRTVRGNWCLQVHCQLVDSGHIHHLSCSLSIPLHNLSVYSNIYMNIKNTAQAEVGPNMIYKHAWISYHQGQNLILNVQLFSVTTSFLLTMISSRLHPLGAIEVTLFETSSGEMNFPLLKGQLCTIAWKLCPSIKWHSKLSQVYTFSIAVWHLLKREAQFKDTHFYEQLNIMTPCFSLKLLTTL